LGKEYIMKRTHKVIMTATLAIRNIEADSSYEAEEIAEEMVDNGLIDTSDAEMEFKAQLDDKPTEEDIKNTILDALDSLDKDEIVKICNNLSGTSYDWRRVIWYGENYDE
jgi:hypothetical protein